MAKDNTELRNIAKCLGGRGNSIIGVPKNSLIIGIGIDLPFKKDIKAEKPLTDTPLPI